MDSDGCRSGQRDVGRSRLWQTDSGRSKSGQMDSCRSRLGQTDSNGSRCPWSHTITACSGVADAPQALRNTTGVMGSEHSRPGTESNTVNHECIIRHHMT